MRKPLGHVELAVLKQDGQPVENIVFRPVEIQYAEAGAVQLIMIGIAVVVRRASPLLRQLSMLGAVESPSVVVVDLPDPKDRLLH